MSDNVKKVLVAGTGYMAREYIRVLKSLGNDYIVVGNREESVRRFIEETGENAYSGGVESYISSNHEVPEYAIVAVTHGNLFHVTKALLEAGVSRILVEKPGATCKHEIEQLISIAKEKNASVYVAYNRRFYQSVLKAKELIKSDGGLRSVIFEFTEWAHVVEKTPHSDEMKQKWFLLNSTHVVDLFINIAGYPKTMNSQISGSLDWHKAGSIYNGCGVTEKNVSFVYHADWGAPGRWGIELLTSKHRLYLKPLEKLQIQDVGSIKVEEYLLENDIDQRFKPGLYEETKAFLSDDLDKDRLCGLTEHYRNMECYQKISGEVY